MISSAITSTGMRQTQNLTAPPTQNTAPVIEYQCLYTHDLVRKQKRWQDGFLRFHTFNKRIMVYESPSRNFIGDKHWRQDGPLQDGDELQLEKPILIQVGERVGETETDLTELLDKRRKPMETSAKGTVKSPRHEIPRPASSVDTTGSFAAQPSQLRPKSLNTVLGTPKGSIGRAALPTKSPHDIRKEHGGSDWENDRPTKRQRMDPEMQARSRPNPRSTFSIPAVMGKPPVTAAKDKVLTKVADGQFENSQSYLVAETTPKHSASTRKVASGSEQSNKQPARQLGDGSRKAKRPQRPSTRENSRTAGTDISIDDQTSDRTSVRHDNHDTSTKQNMNVRSSSRSFGRPESVHEPIQVLSDGETRNNSEPQKRKTKLQLASRKPRRKLMYKDLLPQDLHPAEPATSAEKTADARKRGRGLLRNPSSDAELALADFHEDEQNRLADRINRLNGKISNTTTKSIEKTSQRESESASIFISDDESDVVPVNLAMAPQETPKSPFSTPKKRRKKSPRLSPSPEHAIPKAPSSVHDTALTLAKMDEIMFSSSRQQPSPRPPSPFPVEESTSNPNANHDPALQIPTTPPRNADEALALETPVVTTLISSSPGFQSPFPVSNKDSSPKPLSRPATSPLGSPSHADSPQKNLPPKHHALVNPSQDQKPPNNPTQTHTSPTSPTPNPQSPNPPPINSPTSISPSPKPPSLTPNLPPLLPTKPLFSHSPSPTETDLPHHLSIHQKPLPAFQAPRPKPRPNSRSPLKKSQSDTTSMRAPASVLPAVDDGERLEIGRIEGGSAQGEGGEGTPWSKEAWDLFGCARDGVECTYEEFRRKEGLGV